MSDMITKTGLCVQCQPEVYAATYAQNRITPKLYPDDWKERQKKVDEDYERQAKEAEETLVIVVTLFEDEGIVELGLCKRHLREALEILGEAVVR